MTRPVGYALIADAYDFSDFPAALDEAERLGVDCVELPLYALHLVADGRPVEHRVAALERIVAGRPFAYSAHGFLDVNPMAAPDERPAHVRAAAAMTAIAGRLGCRHVVYHAGRAMAGDADAMRAAVDRQRGVLATIGDDAVAAGVVAAIENVFTLGGERTLGCAELGAELGTLGHPGLTACLDLGHAAIVAAERGLDLMAEVAALAPLSRHIHVHDNFARPHRRRYYHPAEAYAFGEGDLHLAPGDGALPLEAMVRDGGVRADAWLMFELDGLRWPDLARGLAVVRSRLAG